MMQLQQPQSTTVRHSSYVELSADSHFGMGVKLGERLGHAVRCQLYETRALYGAAWEEYRERAREYLRQAETMFPHLVNELQGYAAGADVSFDDLWLSNLRHEVLQYRSRRSSSIVTNGGLVSGHNEDCSEVGERPFILRRTFRGKTKLELHYPGTLGGNAWSVNRSGWVQLVSSLRHREQAVGVPQCLIARWLSDAEDPQRSVNELARMPHSANQNFTWHHFTRASQNWTLETTARHHDFRRATVPFSHTNHYLGTLRDGDFGVSLESQRRLNESRQYVLPRMSALQMQDLLSRGYGCGPGALFNSSTIARVVVSAGVAWNWLRSERHLGWVPYAVS